jgi:hypothetical protein
VIELSTVTLVIVTANSLIPALHNDEYVPWFHCLNAGYDDSSACTPGEVALGLPVSAFHPLRTLEPQIPSTLEHACITAVCPAMDQPGLIGCGAHKPNPSLKLLEFLIGEWRTTGTHPMVPGKELPGRTSFAWHEGGAFIVMRSEVDEPGFPDGVAMIGSDNAANRFSMIYFDQRGVSRILDVTLGEETITWRHDNPDFAQRLTIKKAGDRLVSKGLMSEKGGPWKDDLSQVFERVT